MSFDVMARGLRPRAGEPAAEILHPRDVLFLGEQYCFPATGGFRCAPLGGGPSTPWIPGATRVERLGPNNFAAIVESEGDVRDIVRADATGKPGPSLAQARAAYVPASNRLGRFGVVGDDTIVYESAGPSEGLYAVAAMGGNPRDLGIGLFESSQVYVHGRTVVEAHHLQPRVRVDVDTLQRDTLPALPPAAMVAHAGATTLLVDYRSVRLLGAETLYEVASSSTVPAPILTTWAVTDDALYILVLDSPCGNEVLGTRGGAPGDRSCADRPGFWAIVRVPFPA